MALEIERCENPKGSCVFCLYKGTQYRLRYSANTRVGRSVTFPICRKCHRDLVEGALATIKDIGEEA